jgi:hypothetical protein
MPKLGGMGWLDPVERDRGTVGIDGAREEEERADRWGPHGSDTEEKKRIGEKAQLKRKGLFQKNTPRALGLTRPTKEATSCGGGGGQASSMDWASLAESQKRNQMEIDFQISNEFQFFCRTLKISTRRFRKNLDMGNFPKFF